MDKLHDERHRECERLYQALEDLGGLPRQRAIGLRGAVLMWRLADALQYVPRLESAMAAVEERKRFLERRNADLVRQFVNLIAILPNFY